MSETNAWHSSLEHLPLLLEQGYVTQDEIALLQEQDRRLDDYLTVASVADAIAADLVGQYWTHPQQPPVRCCVRPSDDLNASASQAGDGSALVLLDDSLLHYLLTYDLAFASTLSVSSTSQRDLEALFSKTGQTLFEEVLWYLSNGTMGTRADFRRFARNQQDLGIAASVLDAQIRFLVLHELGHVLNGDTATALGEHGAPGGLPAYSMDSHLQELGADGFAAKALITACGSDDDLTYTVNAALPLFFGAVSFAGVMAAHASESPTELEWMFDDRRFLSSHPDSERRLRHLHLLLLDSVDHQMVNDMPDGRIEWQTEEYRKMWNHALMFCVNNTKAVFRGLVDIHGLFPTPVDFEQDVLQAADLYHQLSGKVIY
jgi:hypothetical protein